MEVLLTRGFWLEVTLAQTGVGGKRAAFASVIASPEVTMAVHGGRVQQGLQL